MKEIFQSFAAIGSTFAEMLKMDTFLVGMNVAYVYKPKILEEQNDIKLPLIVMLHGSTQSATEFAAITKMNDYAEEYGFCVAYVDKNMLLHPKKAFDFISKHNENQDILSIKYIIEKLRNKDFINNEKIYLVGLSAGAALASIFTEHCPEYIDGSALVAGLPPDCAENLSQALDVMKNGCKKESILEVNNPNINKKLKILILHGDEDDIVHINNAHTTYKVMQKLVDYTEDGSLNDSMSKSATRLKNGNKIMKTTTENGSVVLFEEVKGLGHAWRGGDNNFAYTDSGEVGNQFSTSKKIIDFFEIKKFRKTKKVEENNFLTPVFKYKF